MRLPSRVRAAAVAIATAALLIAGVPAAHAAPAAPPRTHVQRACAPLSAGRMSCLAEVLVHSTAVRPHRAAQAEPAIEGLRPADVASAYGLKGGRGGVVAVVDAYDDPALESDLAVYRAHFGLPTCTAANGCFRKVDQRGAAGPLPEPDPGWGLEESLDVDAVSAACPGCGILVVEADEPTEEALGEAVRTAVRLGASAVSNSYGGYETTGVDARRGAYDQPGVAVLAASGDSGFPSAITPATYASVIAVGGTTLASVPTGRRWRETAWAGGGSGCSAYIAKPSWQKDRHCPMRTITDVAAVADPETGLAVRDTFGTEDFTDDGWLQVGGTSLSTPLVSAMLVRSGKAAAYASAKRLYSRRGSFRDVTGGSNGVCGRDELCTAKKGWDAPTGVGSPRSLASF